MGRCSCEGNRPSKSTLLQYDAIMKQDYFPTSPWFCVISIDDLRLLYLGRDEASARALKDASCVLASGPLMGAAWNAAALDAGDERKLRKHGLDW